MGVFADYLTSVFAAFLLKPNKGSVYSLILVVRIAVNLILTANNITA
jgi:hypothetical protein